MTNDQAIKPSGFLGMLTPDHCVGCIQDIDLPALYGQGIRSLLIDMDNTLNFWGSHQVTDAMHRFVADARSAGLQVCVLSNGRGPRVGAMSAELGVPHLAMAGKPRKGAYRKGMDLIGAEPQTSAFVGDQLFTDILGGNRSGLYTILSRPMHPQEHWWTKLVRIPERRALAALRRRNAIPG